MWGEHASRLMMALMHICFPSFPNLIKKYFFFKKEPGMAMHICNPSCSGGENRRIMTLKPAQAKVPCLKIKTKGLEV
jgi:hypothetical protein